MPRSPSYVIARMYASVEVKTLHAHKPLLPVSMESLGITARLAEELTGSVLTYASVVRSCARTTQSCGGKDVLEIFDEGAR